MQQLEAWFLDFWHSPQHWWIVLLIAGFIIVEMIMHQEDKAYRNVATGISACFGMFCVYILTSLLFGPVHHSFLENFQLSSCLPFMSDRLTGGDWAIFSFLSIPKNYNDLCYGILRLFLICIIYNLVNDVIEERLKEGGKRFLVWGGIQIGVIFVFTVLLSSVNYIIERLVFYVPAVGSALDFIREQSVIVFCFIIFALILALFAKVVVSTMSGKKAEEIPVLGFAVKMFFGGTFGMSLLKAAITTYFLMIVFKLITITYVRTMVINSIGPFVFMVVVILVFLWYKLRQELLPKS